MEAAVLKYRKKPIVIEAVCFDSPSSGNMIVLWSKGKVVWSATGDDTLYVFTPEGFMKANKGDFVIRGVKGEFYPCKPDIFEETYKQLTEE